MVHIYLVTSSLLSFLEIQEICESFLKLLFVKSNKLNRTLETNL